MRSFRTESGLVARQLGREDIQVRDYIEDTVNLTGGTSAYTSADVKCVRIGNAVTITGLSVFTHASAAIASSGDQLIPEEYRPTGNIYNCYFVAENTWCVILISNLGDILTIYYNNTTNTARADSFAIPSVSYIIT